MALNIQGYQASPNVITEWYNQSASIFYEQMDLVGFEGLAHADTTRPRDLNPKSRWHKIRPVHLHAGVRERLGLLEEYQNTHGVIQGYSRMMKKRELYSKIEEPQEDLEEFRNNPHVIIDFIREHAAMAADDIMQQMNTTFWNLINYGVLSAGNAIFDQSLDDGEVADGSGNYIFDGKPFLVPSTGSQHPISPESGASTLYNHIISHAFTRSNYISAKNLLEHTNAIDPFGRRIIGQKVRYVYANPLMYETIEPIISSEKQDRDLQDNLVARPEMRPIPVYTDYFTDTDGWVIGDLSRCIKWVMNWDEVDIEMWFRPENKSVHMRTSYFYSYYVFDWRGVVGANMAVS